MSIVANIIYVTTVNRYSLQYIIFTEDMFFVRISTRDQMDSTPQFLTIFSEK